MKLLLLALLALPSLVYSAPPTECDGSIKCLRLSWQAPTLREDGSTIQALDGYKLYHTAANVFQGVIDIPATSTEYYVIDAGIGTHSFTISAVEAGLEGEQSSPASLAIVQAQIGAITLTIEVF